MAGLNGYNDPLDDGQQEAQAGAQYPVNWPNSPQGPSQPDGSAPRPSAAPESNDVILFDYDEDPFSAVVNVSSSYTAVGPVAKNEAVLADRIQASHQIYVHLNRLKNIQMSATYKEEKHALATFIARFSYLYFHFELDAATVNDIIDSYIEENRSYRRWYNELLTLATTRYALSEVDGHLKELETRLTDVENNSFSFQKAVADRVTAFEGKLDSINELQASNAEAKRKYNELLHQLKEVQYESVKGLGVLADAVTEIFAAQNLTLPKELGHKLKAFKAARDALPESP